MSSSVHLFRVCAAVVALSGAPSLVHAAPKLPLRADAPVLFLPRGWKIERTVSGDLNRDRVSDAAVVLVENKPARDAQGDATERQRALLVLLREGKGWKRVGWSDQILLGTRDGGAFFGVVETPVSVSIARGVVIVEMESGSREVENTTHRLRFEPKRNGVYLIGFDSVVRDRATGDVTTESTNFLTGVKITRSFNIESDKTKRTTSRVSRSLRSLESLKEEDRYAAE